MSYIGRMSAPGIGNRKIEVTEVTTTSVTLQWQEASDFLGHDLFYKALSSEYHHRLKNLYLALRYGKVEADFTRNITSVTITGLKPATKYYFNVIAWRKEQRWQGKTIYQIVEATTETKPLTKGKLYIKTVAIGKIPFEDGLQDIYTMVFDWTDASDPDDPNADIKYQLAYSSDGETYTPAYSDFRRKNFDSRKISGLKPDTFYKFRLTAKSEYGEVVYDLATGYTLPERALENLYPRPRDIFYIRERSSGIVLSNYPGYDPPDTGDWWDLYQVEDGDDIYFFTDADGIRVVAYDFAGALILDKTVDWSGIISGAGFVLSAYMEYRKDTEMKAFLEGNFNRLAKIIVESAHMVIEQVKDHINKVQKNKIQACIDTIGEVGERYFLKKPREPSPSGVGYEIRSLREALDFETLFTKTEEVLPLLKNFYVGNSNVYKDRDFLYVYQRYINLSGLYNLLFIEKYGGEYQNCADNIPGCDINLARKQAESDLAIDIGSSLKQRFDFLKTLDYKWEDYFKSVFSGLTEVRTNEYGNILNNALFKLFPRHRYSYAGEVFDISVANCEMPSPSTLCMVTHKGVRVTKDKYDDKKTTTTTRYLPTESAANMRKNANNYLHEVRFTSGGRFFQEIVIRSYPIAAHLRLRHREYEKYKLISEKYPFTKKIRQSWFEHYAGLPDADDGTLYELRDKLDHEPPYITKILEAGEPDYNFTRCPDGYSVDEEKKECVKN